MPFLHIKNKNVTRRQRFNFLADNHLTKRNNGSRRTVSQKAFSFGTSDSPIEPHRKARGPL